MGGGGDRCDSAISNQQPATSNQQSAISNQQSAVGSLQSAISSQQSEVTIPNAGATLMMTDEGVGPGLFRWRDSSGAWSERTFESFHKSHLDAQTEDDIPRGSLLHLCISAYHGRSDGGSVCSVYPPITSPTPLLIPTWPLTPTFSALPS
jgi:hypothetical protein